MEGVHSLLGSVLSSEPSDPLLAGAGAAAFGGVLGLETERCRLITVSCFQVMEGVHSLLGSVLSSEPSDPLLAGAGAAALDVV